MSLERYTTTVLAATAASLGLLRALVGARLESSQWTAVYLGALLAAANTVAAFALVQWSARRSTRAFMAAVLGGMLGRMAVMLAAVAAAVAALELPAAALAVSLLSYFVLFLVFELVLLQRRQAEPVRP